MSEGSWPSRHGTCVPISIVPGVNGPAVMRVARGDVSAVLVRNAMAAVVCHVVTAMLEPLGVSVSPVVVRRHREARVPLMGRVTWSRSVGMYTVPSTVQTRRSGGMLHEWR